jgi:tRNA 2-selenouridine synthase
MPISLADFLHLRQYHPVVDVRSPGEYNAGHIRGAVNIPLLSNDERKIVGTTYVQQGQREAIREGFRLVGPRLNEIIDEAGRIANGGEVLVHCWRGGMRSDNFCKFVSMAKIKSQSLMGGYKAYRQGALEAFRGPVSIQLLTGLTGSGKSEILRALADRGEQVLDLENLAHHKGSAFGGLLMPPQPTSEQFQNELFEEMLKLDLSKRVWVEDESLAIGKIFLPVDFWNTMNKSPLVQLDVAKSIRVQRLVNEYGEADPLEFLGIMSKIARKLGGQHFNSAKERLMQGDMATTIDILLMYYDKAYRESIEKRRDRLIRTVCWDGGDVGRLVEELLE